MRLLERPCDKGRNKSSIIIAGDFNALLSIMDRKTRQEIKNDMKDLNNIINQLDLTDISKTVHARTAEHTFFSSAYGTFPRIDYIVGHKETVSKFKKM